MVTCFKNLKGEERNRESSIPVTHHDNVAIDRITRTKYTNEAFFHPTIARVLIVPIEEQKYSGKGRRHDKDVVAFQMEEMTKCSIIKK
jgi:hypothetical protein